MKTTANHAPPEADGIHYIWLRDIRAIQDALDEIHGGDYVI